MRVVNRAPYCLLVFVWHKRFGKGPGLKIYPHQSAFVMGPYDNKKGCYVAPDGELVCYEPSEDENEDRFTVPRQGRRKFQKGELGVTVVYHSEPPPSR